MNAASSRTFLRLLKRCQKKNRLLFWGGLLTVLCSTAITVCEPFLFGWIIDEGIVPKNITVFWAGISLVGAALILRNALIVMDHWLVSLLGERVMEDLRNELYKKVQHLTLKDIAEKPTGTWVSRLTNDIASLSDMFSQGLLSLVANLLLIVGLCVGLILANYQLGICIVLCFPFVVFFCWMMSRKLHRSYQRARQALSELTGAFAERMMGWLDVQLLAEEKRQAREFLRFNHRYLRAQYGVTQVYALFQPGITLIIAFLLFLVLLWGGVLVKDGQLQIGQFVTMISYILFLNQPLRDLIEKWNVILGGITSMERIEEILLLPVEANILASPKNSFAPQKGHLIFDQVSFSYNSESKDKVWALQDLSFEVKPGESAAFVGATGSGKTTVTHLLMRFADPQKGQIWLDGKKLQDWNLLELRKSFARVTQEQFLFSGSLVESLRMGRDFDESRLLHLLEKFGFGDLQTLLERGALLSEGEKQMLSLIRAMVTPPSCAWIFDEATANLDAIRETQFLRECLSESKGVTTLWIAHRLRTIRHVDQIFVLHKGKLVESGPHAELLKLNSGIYSSLYRLQMSQNRREREVLPPPDKTGL